MNFFSPLFLVALTILALVFSLVFSRKTELPTWLSGLTHVSNATTVAWAIAFVAYGSVCLYEMLTGRQGASALPTWNVLCLAFAVCTLDTVVRVATRLLECRTTPEHA